MTERARRRGFTIIELLVALAVGGVAILGAAAMLGAVSDQAERVAEVTRTMAERANGERLLRALAASYQPSVNGEATFIGESESARFVSWCQTSNGWPERCWVRLSVLPADAALGRTTRLVASLSTGGTEVVLSGFEAAELRYLDDASNGGRWFHTWGAGISAPLAIGVVRVTESRTDTLIVRLGVRS